MSTKPTFQRSADTSLLVTLFGRAKMGELVPYEEISKTIGRDAKQHRSAIFSALRILHSENGMVFGCVPTEGYRRLDDQQIVASVQQIRECQHRQSRKALRRLAVVNTQQISDDARKDYYTQLSIQGALQHVTAAKSQQKIASQVNGGTQQLAVAMTLKALAE